MIKPFSLGLLAVVATATVSAAGFAPWTDVLKMADKNNDGKLSPGEIVHFEQRDHYSGFQPFMVDHFPKYDFDGDGFLSFEECKKGMQMAGYSDEEIMMQYKRDFGFRPWNNSKTEKVHEHGGMKK